MLTVFRKNPTGRVPGYLLPDYRIPDDAQVVAMFPAERMRQRLDRDPFISLHILASNVPDKIFK